jgi:hypothetical protein
MALSASFKTVWSREMQEVLWVTNVWRPQANFRLEDELKDGDTIKRIYPTRMVPTSYTRYSDVTFQTGTTTAESLTVDTTPTIPFIISDLDELQSTPKARAKFTDMAVEQLNLIINGYYTAEVTNATSVVDAADFGGTSGQGATITPANINKMFSIAQRRLGRQNVYKYKPGESPFFANLTPELYQALLERLEGKESVLGDKLSENGHAGMYMGFDLYVHNGSYWTGDLYMPTQPTDGDTMVIKVADQTITITFRATLGSSAGSVHIASTVDITRANLAEFLNSPGSSEAEDTDTGYVALSAEHQAILYGSTWTNNNSTDKLTCTWRGVGIPLVSETFTSANNIWSVGTNISHNMFGRKGAVDFVIQRYPKIQIDAAENRIEEWKIKPYTLFGKKTFQDGARKLVNVKVATENYT